MGQMIDGVWRAENLPVADAKSGEFKRKASTFRSWITPDGAAGPSGDSGFAAAPGRYHLYVSWSCPWAHRTRLMRSIKGLEDHVSLSITAVRRSDQGWIFTDDDRFRDHLYGKQAVHEFYSWADPDFTGRITVPVLWDRERETIVNNESSEIIQMFNSAFQGLPGVSDIDFYPGDLRVEIDAVNDDIYENLNNGVYRAGFASSQEAYDDAVPRVFDCLDRLEERLATRRYLCGDRQTLADWRAFPTLVRFDAAYVGAFKCNIRRLVDYPNLWAYTRDLYQSHPAVAETVDPQLFAFGYYSHGIRNPTGIVPIGPELDFDAPHGRELLAAA